MRVHPLALFLAFLLAALLTVQAQAADCIFKGETEAARVVRRSGEVLTPHPQALSDANCETLRVESGAVRVYTMAANRATVEERRVVTGRLVSVDAAASAGSSFSIIRQQMSALLSGLQRQHTGSSRGDGEDYPSVALPTGRLSQPLHDLVIPLGPAPDPYLRHFELWANGSSVARVDGPAEALRLPAAALMAGASATWKLDYDGRESSGEFIVDPPDTLAQHLRRLEHEQADEKDATLRQLRIAAGLAALGYRWDSRANVAAAIGR